MDIRLELLREHIAEFISLRIEDFSIDASAIANTAAISVLSQIQCILKNNDFNDFEAIEEIVQIFESNGLSCGGRHDFG
ncbi:MAG: hypothetical protein IJC81_01685 [Clostridia bacterium]|nr:hypothetical protein [Clostridia bacterium]